MLILALDPATKCGWCCGRVGDKPQLGTINFGGRQLDDYADIFWRARLWIDTQLSANAMFGVPDRVAIEQPIPPWRMLGKTQAATTLIAYGLFAEFTGSARGHLVKFMPAPITEWRKYMQVTSAESKIQMMRKVAQLGWADEDTDHNAAEAAGIWLWAGAMTLPQRVMRHEPLFVGR